MKSKISTTKSVMQVTKAMMQVFYEDAGDESKGGACEVENGGEEFEICDKEGMI
jgi:hypothetical protein